MAAVAVTVALVLFFLLHGLASVKDVVVFRVLHHRALTPAALLGALRASDVVAALGAAAVAVWLGWAEWRRRALSRFLASAPEAAWLAVLTLLLVFLAHSYLYAGVLLGGDSGSHISRFHEMAEGFAHGELAEWTNYQYLGSPLLEFTGPLTYVVGGALAYLLGDAVLAAKLLLFVLDVAGGLLCYALLRRFGLARFGASVGALGYTGAFAHLHLFLYRGVFPEAFIICFFLAAFLGAEGLMAARERHGRWRWRDWALFAFATAGLITTHQPHALFTAIYLGVFGLASLVLGRWRLAGAGALVSAGVVGAAMAAVAVLPILAEWRWVMIDPEGGFAHLQLPTLARLLDLVVWRNTRTTWGTDYWAYVGIVLLALAVIGIVHTFRTPRAAWGRRERLVAAVSPCLVLGFFLANPVVRDILFLLLFLAVPASVGAEVVAGHYARAPRAGLVVRAPRAGLVVLGLLLLDLTSTSIQPVARTDKGFLIAGGEYLARVAPGRRVAEAVVEPGGRLSLEIGPGGGPMSYDAMVGRVAGNHNMAATPVHNYAVTAVKMAERDLNRDGRLSPGVADLLGMLNVARIICSDPVAAGCPARLAGTSEDGPLGRVVPVADPSPVLFSQSLVALRPPAGLDHPMLKDEQFAPPLPQVRAVEAFLRAFVASARPDMASGVAAALPVQVLPGTAVPPAPAPAGPWRPRVVSYRVGLQTVSITLDSDRAGYAQLAHPYFPSNRVRVNGRLVTPIVGAWHLLVVPIAAGVTTITITPGTTQVRIAAGGISLFALLVGIVVPLAGGWRRRRRAGPP